MDVIVVGLLVLPPLIVGIVGWCAARLSARDERRHDVGIGRSREGYARLRGEADEPIVHDRRAA